MEPILVFNKILGILSLVSGVVAIFLLIGNFNQAVGRTGIYRALAKRGLLFAWMVALGASLISLFYSEIAGYPPCVLCWYQRIFMYPLIILLGWALIKRNYAVVEPALILAFIGALIAIYHQLLDFGLMPETLCLASAISCNQRFVFEFGFLGIPTMSLISFVLLLVLLGAAKKNAASSLPPQFVQK